MGRVVHRSMTIQKESRWPWLKYFFQFTLPAFLISMKAQGQEATRKTNDTVQVHATSNQVKGLSSHSPYLTIRGRVVAPDGSGIAAATVETRGDSKPILTDQDGYFSVNWPKDKNLVLFVSCIGCKPVRKKIKEMYRMQHVVLQVKMNWAVMGEVIITY